MNFQRLYDKLTDPCCAECIEESDAMLRELNGQHLIDHRDVLLILQERSRCLALALDRESARVRMKKVVKPILARLAGPLSW